MLGGERSEDFRRLVARIDLHIEDVLVGRQVTQRRMTSVATLCRTLVEPDRQLPDVSLTTQYFVSHYYIFRRMPRRQVVDGAGDRRDQSIIS